MRENLPCDGKCNGCTETIKLSSGAEVEVRTCSKGLESMQGETHEDYIKALNEKANHYEPLLQHQ